MCAQLKPAHGTKMQVDLPCSKLYGRIRKHFLQSPMGKHCFVISLKKVLQEIHQFDQMGGKLQSTPYRLTGVQIEC
jgi:hypothetical protein